MRRIIFGVAFGVVLGLGGCEDMMQHKETARQALQTFCTLKRIDIISNALLTPDQQAAGAKVCAAVGLAMGS